MKKKKHQPISRKRVIGVIKNGIIFTLWGVMTLFFIIEGIQSVRVANAIDNSDYEVYCGKYDVLERKTMRNTVHEIALESGDQITVICPSDYFYGDNAKLKEFSELKICYSKQSFLRTWAPVCISIESLNGSTMILDDKIVQEELIGSAILFLCLGTICLLLLLVCFFYPVFSMSFYKRFKKKRRS